MQPVELILSYGNRKGIIIPVVMPSCDLRYWGIYGFIHFFSAQQLSIYFHFRAYFFPSLSASFWFSYPATNTTLTHMAREYIQSHPTVTHSPQSTPAVPQECLRPPSPSPFMIKAVSKFCGQETISLSASGPVQGSWQSVLRVLRGPQYHWQHWSRLCIA